MIKKYVILLGFLAGCGTWNTMNTMDRLCQEQCFSEHQSSMAYRDLNGNCWCKLDEAK